MNGLAGLFIERAVLFAWVLGRIAGFLVTSPFPGADIPQTARVTLALSLSWVVASFAEPASRIVSLDLGVVMAVAVEIGCGAAMGFVMRLLVGVADMVGDMVAQSSGLQTGAVLNPESGAADPTLARVVSLCAMLLALGMGAHRVALAHVLESFRSLPAGSSLAIPAAAPVLAAMVGEVLATALRLAMPVVAVCLLTQIGLALIARAAPAMQIFNVGLAVTVAAGVLTLLSTADALGGGISEAFATMPEKMGQVLLPMRP